MNNINYVRMSEEAKDKIMRRAHVHVEFACRLHRKQHRAGRFFVHEHPAWATSWREKCVQAVIKETGAKLTRIDQCIYGRKAIKYGDHPDLREQKLLQEPQAHAP